MSDIKISANASIDQQTWDEAKAVLDCHFLSVSDALYLLMYHIAGEGKLPFSCVIPGPATITAMEEFDNGETVTFDTVEELMAYLTSDEDEDAAD